MVAEFIEQKESFPAHDSSGSITPFARSEPSFPPSGGMTGFLYLWLFYNGDSKPLSTVLPYILQKYYTPYTEVYEVFSEARTKIQMNTFQVCSLTSRL